MNSHWIDTDTFGLSQETAKHESTLTISISPYDVPEAVRSYSDDNEIVIEFRYIQINEKKTTTNIDKGVTVEVGSKTKRIYKIIFDAKIYKVSSVSSSTSENIVDKFIEKQERKTSQFSRDKYDLNKKLLHDYREKLELAF